MAVWLYAYGKNELENYTNKNILDNLNKVEINEIKILDSIKEITEHNEPIEKYYIRNRKKIERNFFAKTDKEYNEYLNSISLPYIERSKIVDHFITEGLERERKEKELFQTLYNQIKNENLKSEWEKGNNNYFNRLCNLGEYDGIRVWFVNDLVCVSGPFEIFSVYERFQKSISVKSREYYHSLFIEIFKIFKSEFILYTHEWAGLDDEEDIDFDFKKLKEQSDWINSTSSSIHSMTNFYFEKIYYENDAITNK